MTQFFIPPIGQQMRLLRNWEFMLHEEPRNDRLVTALFGAGFNFGRPGGRLRSAYPRDMRQVRAVVAAGTVLRVERIYIRQGLAGFDSVSFRVVDSPDPRLSASSARFWAKLGDVNGLDVDFVAGVPTGSKRSLKGWVRRGTAADAEVRGVVRITAEDIGT